MPPRNTLLGGVERPEVVAPVGGDEAAPGTDAERKALPKDTLFEVMIDTFGYGGKDGSGKDSPQFIRGDLITAADAPGFDLVWAERVGSIRQAPEYKDRAPQSTTQPVDSRGKVQPPPADAPAGAPTSPTS